uniref:H/ACA ribonucleoprotein complex non-core subunit NAF1 n=1 Tax=Salix viminalis TaxID=40686 RepID=A0A6N2M2D0_SALVM
MELDNKGLVVKDLNFNGSDSVFEEKKGIDDGSDLGGLVKVKEERVELEIGGSLGCSIEEEMGRVSLVAEPSLVVVDGGRKVVADEAETGNGGLMNGQGSDIGDDSGLNGKIVSEEESKSVSESESESESSSSSSSSDDDEQEKESDQEEEEKGEVRMEVNKGLDGLGDIEEGEIRDVDGQEIVAGNDSGDKEEEEEEEEEEEFKMVEWSDVDEEEDAGTVEPIRSKNELQFLPPVPPVHASLELHHQMLPVGVVLSHNPLNEGSILWITEKRSPLGLVDEIFGPVENPFYVVRYNSESEVPAGIHDGTLISFVPEFANHVLNIKNLHKKGYDASGEHDEEVTDEAEFSDDEKEAEHKRMLKLSKRGINDEKFGKNKNNRRKVKNRGGGWKNLGEQMPTGADHLPPDQNSRNDSAAGTSLAQMPQATGVYAPSNGVWPNMLPSQQPQTLAIPGGFRANNMPWPVQSQLQHPCQIPMATGMPIQQQFNPGQGSFPNALLPGGQPNFFAGPLASSSAMASMNVVEQGMIPTGPPLGQNCNFQPPAIPPGNMQAPQQFNAGSSSSHGRKPYRRGGGRFSGGRGRQPSN